MQEKCFGMSLFESLGCCILYLALCVGIFRLLAILKISLSFELLVLDRLKKSFLEVIRVHVGIRIASTLRQFINFRNFKQVDPK